ncbi:MAG: heavy-metal-associated domain-containing protein, partial [Pyrobaculum sp.]
MGVKIGLEGRQTVLKILGMHCATCTLTVQKALMAVRGVKWVEASLASNEARLVVNPSVDYSELAWAVRRAGYDVYREAAYFYLDVRPEEAGAAARAVGRWGVFNSIYNPAVGALYVEYNPLEVSVEEVARRLKEAGFEVRRIELGEAGVDLDKKVAEAERRDLARRL